MGRGTTVKRKVGIVGGRGYTGAELLRLLANHPDMELAFASSSSDVGQPLTSACSTWPDPNATFRTLGIEDIPETQTDAWVLAVPNGVAAEWAQAIFAEHPDAVVVDLSADHRFDDAWTYGQPERFREEIHNAKRISNPGCYATGIQLALLPLVPRLVGCPVVFGVSGYSGAGKNPSPRNSPERLKDNLIPYSLSGHVHELEVSHQLGCDVRFMPHVAAFFRGISLTISASLSEAVTVDELFELYSSTYRNEELVRVFREIPEVAAIQGSHEVHIGGFNVDARDARRVSLVATLDNLAKGAATQAMQNLNLALGFEELAGIKP